MILCGIASGSIPWRLAHFNRMAFVRARLRETAFITTDEALSMIIQRLSGTLIARVYDINDQVAAQEFVRIYRPVVTSWCNLLEIPGAYSASLTQSVVSSLVETIRTAKQSEANIVFSHWLLALTQATIAETITSRTTADRSASQPHYLAVISQNETINKLFVALEKQAQIDILQQAQARIQRVVKPMEWDVWFLTVSCEQEPWQVTENTGLSIADVYVTRSRVDRMIKDEVHLMNGHKKNGSW